jgi:glycosyltransferase involved in cell wall biosynthesis
MTVLAAFSKYLAYDVGGAEKSTRTLLTDRARAGSDRIVVVAARHARFVGRPASPAALPCEWELRWLEGFAQTARFPYLEYLRNRRRLVRWFGALEADELWTYGTWAPAAALGFPGPTVFYVRSETDLGIVGNYFTGAKRLARHLYGALEHPAIAAYRSDLKRAAARSRVVANSRYIARRVEQCLGVQASVVLPPVDVAPMRARLQGGGAPAGDPAVVFVGDNAYKGLPIVLEVARMLPTVPFRIFSRFVAAERRDGNVQWMPWQSQPWRVFSGARLVIVPSQWEEAYGRIAREAYLLGVPVLVSATGGLPEAVDERPDCLVDNFRDPGAWTDAIRRQILH